MRNKVPAFTSFRYLLYCTNNMAVISAVAAGYHIGVPPPVMQSVANLIVAASSITPRQRDMLRFMRLLIIVSISYFLRVLSMTA